MYPRNAASPERLTIGAVVQISDGAVQGSGVSIAVTPQGGSAAGGGGTTSYSTGGSVLYVPTQAETNYTSFVVEAYKTGCMPASITVVTTASATPGTVLLAPVTHTNAVVPTVTTLTNLPAITAGWLTATGIAANALDNKGNWNVGKTGYTLSQTFPTNFADLAITASTGRVTVGTNADKNGYALTTADWAQAGDAMTLTAAYDAAKSAAAAGAAMTLTSAYDFAKGTAAMTEAYAANGAAPTPVQAIFAIHQMLMDFAIASTTYTVKKLDNTATAFIVTLDSDTAPTSAVRT